MLFLLSDPYRDAVLQLNRISDNTIDLFLLHLFLIPNLKIKNGVFMYHAIYRKEIKNLTILQASTEMMHLINCTRET